MKVIKFLMFIDFFFLYHAQCFSWWLQNTTGYTNFSLARLTLLVSTALHLLHYADGVYSLGVKVVVGIFMSIQMLVCIVLLFMIRIAEKRCRAKEGIYINILAITLIPSRLFIFLFVGFFLIQETITIIYKFEYQILISMLTDFLDISFFYFVSCTPLPPGASKLGMRLKILIKKISERFSPAPQPA